MQKARPRTLPFVVCALLAGCAAGPSNVPVANVPEAFPGYLAGYLPKEALPDSAALLPAPPAPGSAALAADQEANRRALALRGTPRFALAAEDADLLFPHAAGTFSCALNVPVTEADTPQLYVLLRRVLGDAAGSTGRAKNEYKRMRPFLVNRATTCTPGEDAELGKQGSYPSGHSAIGWAWALVLAEVAPDREDAILARGEAFGQSRVVCNVHWQSDVTEGRVMGAATFARLHADPAFLADLAAAKKEIAAARARGLAPSRDCRAETAALARTIPAGAASEIAPSPPLPVAERSAILKAAREISSKARYAAFVTIGPDGQPQARIVDPLGPDAEFTVWIATNPATRKVADLARDPRATLQFFEASLPAYVTLVGTASLVAEPEIKALHWKDDWGPFYKDRFRGPDFVLLKFVPKRLEIVSQAHGLVSDPRNWRPVTLDLPEKPAR